MKRSPARSDPKWLVVIACISFGMALVVALVSAVGLVYAIWCHDWVSIALDTAWIVLTWPCVKLAHDLWCSRVRDHHGCRWLW